MTIPEPSPLPRFGIRHLLGLTAALAVASVLSRSTVLEAFSRDESIVMDDSSVAFRYAYSIGSILLVTSLSVNLFLVGCLLIWSWKIPGWKYQPGHYFVWAALLGCLNFAFMKWMENTSSWIVARSCYTSEVVVLIVTFILPIFAALRVEHKRWKWVFVSLIVSGLCMPGLTLIGFLAQYGYPSVAFLSIYFAYGSYALTVLILLALALAIAIDVRTRTPRHWSHWWATIILFVSYWSGFVSLVLIFTLR